MAVAIAGVKGFPGKSGKGELSIIPRQIEILAPCIQPFPNSKYGIREPVRRTVQCHQLCSCVLATYVNAFVDWLEGDTLSQEVPRPADEPWRSSEL